MLKKILQLSFALIALHSHALAIIVRTDSFEVIQYAVNKADRNTLVIFDIDDVLLIGKDQGRHTHYNDLIEAECLKIKKKYSEEEAFKLFSIMWQQAKSELVETKFSTLIRDLSKHKIKVIAITNAWTGKFGHIDNIEKWRVNELKELGIDFVQSFPDIPYFLFDSLVPKVKGRIPTYLDGVLFTANLPKGRVLEAFLRYVSFTPKKVIFIDDKFNNLLSVEEFTTRNAIDFIGFEYTAIQNRNVHDLNRERVKFQFKILETEKKWLSDEKADKRQCVMVK